MTVKSSGKIKWRYPPAYKGAHGILSLSLSLPQIFKLAGVPKRRQSQLTKVYNQVIGRNFKREFTRIYPEPYRQDVDNILKEATKGKIDSHKLPPSVLADFFPNSISIISNSADRPIEQSFVDNEYHHTLKGIRDDRINAALKKKWQKIYPHFRSVFRKEGKNISQVKGSGHIEAKDFPFESSELVLNKAMGGEDLGVLAYDFAASLEIIQALKKNKMWLKFKNRIRIPLSTMWLQEGLHRGTPVNIEKYFSLLFKLPYNLAPQDWILGQTHYTSKNSYKRIGGPNQILIPKEEFMRAQGFKGSDFNDVKKRNAAVDKFVKDIGSFLGIMHKEGIIMGHQYKDDEKARISPLTMKDLGPNAQTQDFDPVQIKKWGVRINKDEMIEDQKDVIHIINELSNRMKVNPDNVKSQFYQTYNKFKGKL